VHACVYAKESVCMRVSMQKRVCACVCLCHLQSAHARGFRQTEHCNVSYVSVRYAQYVSAKGHNAATSRSQRYASVDSKTREQRGMGHTRKRTSIAPRFECQKQSTREGTLGSREQAYRDSSLRSTVHMKTLAMNSKRAAI
jgi:hypothetical protein